MAYSHDLQGFLECEIVDFLFYSNSPDCVPGKSTQSGEFASYGMVTVMGGQGSEVTPPTIADTRNLTEPVERPVGVAFAEVGLVIADPHVAPLSVDFSTTYAVAPATGVHVSATDADGDVPVTEPAVRFSGD